MEGYKDQISDNGEVKTGQLYQLMVEDIATLVSYLNSSVTKQDIIPLSFRRKMILILVLLRLNLREACSEDRKYVQPMFKLCTA